MIKIVLSGYMGSGKTEIAQLLQQKSGIAALDLDNIIEEKAGMTIPEMFASKGEIYFRKLEHQALKEVMLRKESFVLSLGGGTPCYANNHELIKGEDIVSVYLRALPATLYARLIADNKNRPLIAGKNPEEMKEFIAMHLFERSFYYNQADYKIDTDGKTPEQICSEIEMLLA